MKKLLVLALPVALSHLLVMTMGLVDLAFVRHVGTTATGAVGVASALFGWTLTIGLGLLAGLDFFVSTAYGAGQWRTCHVYFGQGIWLALITGIPLSLVTIAGLPVMLGVGIDYAIQMHARVEEEVVIDRNPHPIQETARNLCPALLVVTFDAVSAPKSATALLATYIGGVGGFAGPILGAILVVLLQSLPPRRHQRLGAADADDAPVPVGDDERGVQVGRDGEGGQLGGAHGVAPIAASASAGVRTITGGAPRQPPRHASWSRDRVPSPPALTRAAPVPRPRLPPLGPSGSLTSSKNVPPW